MHPTERQALTLAREALEQMIACHDEPTCPALDVAREAVAAIDAALEPLAPPWKCGNEFAPYHPSASHVDPSYRDGWNACYKAASPIASRTVVSSPGAAIRVEALELTEAGREMLTVKEKL